MGTNADLITDDKKGVGFQERLLSYYDQRVEAVQKGLLDDLRSDRSSRCWWKPVE